MATAPIPPITAEDRLPHDKAVWRSDGMPNCEGHRLVTVEYGGGAIEQCNVGQAQWHAVKRWRFGWAPA